MKKAKPSEPFRPTAPLSLPRFPLRDGETSYVGEDGIVVIVVQGKAA